MRSTMYLSLLLSLVLFSCTTKQNSETREWTALYSIVGESLVETAAKDFKTLGSDVLQSSDRFLKLYQNSVFLEKQIIRRTILAELLDKKGTIVNSINVTTNYPSNKDELIRYSLYIVGELKLYPFNNLDELANLYKTFDELSSILANDKNRK